MWLIAKRTTTLQFHKLTSKLKIKRKEKNIIRARHCTNKTDVLNAKVEILESWWDNQESDEEAYDKIGKALIGAGLKRIAREIWNYVPATKSCKRSSHNNGGTHFCSSRRLARWNCQLASFLQMSVIVKISTEVDDVVRQPARAAEMSTTNVTSSNKRMRTEPPALVAQC